MTDRHELISAHLQLAKKAAAMIHPRVREHMELDELIALGNAGLAEAASRYDPSHGASFSTFAWYRVHGAIIDGLRKSTSLPRRTWAKLVALRAASDVLEQRAASDVGATRAGAPRRTTEESLSEVRAAIAAIQTVYVTSLEAMREEGGDVPEVAAGADERLHMARMGTRVREGLGRLPERERQLLEKHYFEGKNLLEAGAELGISKSWASRLHAQAVERLRSWLESTEPKPEKPK